MRPPCGADRYAPAVGGADLLASCQILAAAREGETTDALSSVGRSGPERREGMDDRLRALGYASGSCIGKLLTRAILGEAPDMSLFPVDRFTEREAA